MAEGVIFVKHDSAEASIFQGTPIHLHDVIEPGEGGNRGRGGI